jgi:hypothetical protein
LGGQQPLLHFEKKRSSFPDYAHILGFSKAKRQPQPAPLSLQSLHVSQQKGKGKERISQTASQELADILPSAGSAGGPEEGWGREPFMNHG